MLLPRRGDFSKTGCGQGGPRKPVVAERACVGMAQRHRAPRPALALRGAVWPP